MLPSYPKLLIRSAIGDLPGCPHSGARRTSKSGPNRAEKAEPRPKSNIRVDSTLVLIPVTVTDPLNRFVTGLEKENFKIFEDKTAAGDLAVFQRGRAAFGGRGLRLQRQHGQQAGQIAAGGGAVLQDRQSRGRVLSGAVQRFRLADSAIHAQPGGDSEPPDLHPVQGPDRAAGRGLPGAARDEEGQESAQGAAGDFRWRRQQQPLHREGNQEPGEGSGRPDLCDRNLRVGGGRAAAPPRRCPGRRC